MKEQNVFPTRGTGKKHSTKQDFNLYMTKAVFLNGSSILGWEFSDIILIYRTFPVNAD